jgi:sugar transferase (PEP-CTERM/EpsH1 system associated)
MAGVPPVTRILHFVYGLGRGGLQTGLENLLGGLDRSRFEHVICALRPPIDHPMCQGLSHLARIMCATATESGSRFQVGAIARTIREVKPDIVHSRNWGCIEAVLAARWAGCAVIHGEHGIDTDLVDRELRRRSWFRRLAFETSDRVLAVSRQLQQLHAARTGFPAEKITVVHNGVNDQRFRPDPLLRARVRRELGFADNDFCIVSVGHLTPVKDHMTELRAAAELARVVENWKLVIIGDGPERSQLETFIQADPALKNRVSLPGLTRRVPEMLTAFDVFTLPSVTEGICNSLLEAMATGLPVIATATGGNPEVVSDGQSGLLFPVGDFRALADKLALLARQPDLRLKLGQSAIRRVQDEFSIASMVRGYDEVYSSLGRRKHKAGATESRP